MVITTNKPHIVRTWNAQDGRFQWHVRNDIPRSSWTGHRDHALFRAWAAAWQHAIKLNKTEQHNDPYRTETMAS